MLTKIVSIGNSRGIRIPKAMLDDLDLGDDVDLQAKNGTLIIRPVKQMRAGWTDAFAGMAARQDDFLVQEDVAQVSTFDAEEWTW